MGKIVSLKELLKIRKKAKTENRKVVFTNGCFDLLHLGHIRYLKKAKEKGDILVVGLNSDSSAKKLKGKNRPILPQKDRAEILSSLEFVDYVCVFDEETPLRLITKILPDILVKGADWQLNQIVGRKIILQNRGKVITVPYYKGKSTSNLIRSIVKRFSTP